MKKGYIFHRCITGFLAQNRFKSDIIFFQDENLKEIHNMIEMEDEDTDAKIKAMFDAVHQGKHGLFCVAIQSHKQHLLLANNKEAC